jgi:transposase
MEIPHVFSLGEGLELTQMEKKEDQFVLHVTATSPSALCPLCQQPATRLHSRYGRVVKDLPCAGQQVRLILHVRKFFCETVTCVRKVFGSATAPPGGSMGPDDDALDPDIANDRIGDVWQTRGATGLASGDHHVPL